MEANRQWWKTFGWFMLRLSGFALFCATIYVSEPWRAVPAHWNPWQPLSLDDPMSPVTRWKLAQLKNDSEACLDVLGLADTRSLDYLPLDDYTPVAGCPLTNVVRIRRSDVAFNAPFTVTCPLAVRWVMFERQQLQPLALGHFGSRVARIEHFGSFACRNVYHRASGRRSQHATASAFDIAAFRLDDGTEANVLRHWDDEDAPARAAFLRDVHGAACGYFGTVLGPDYNQPHANHFHVDTSGMGFCR